MKIEHLAIWVRDLEKMRDFYCRFFGAISNVKYTNQLKHFSSYFLSFETGARLELMQKPGIPNSLNNKETQYRGLIHFAISLGTEQRVDALTQQMREEGFEVLDGPRWTGDGYYESVILDPEGNRIELTV
jgi:lactoylglutathione lyase